MRVIVASIFCFICTLWPFLVSAQERPVVVELFTSQGCSSCPPVDAYLHELAKQPNVIAIALHVDYWDYIGWEDSFADPAFTKRQRKYAHAQSERVIYTPQLMINGIKHATGNGRDAVSALIREYASKDVMMQLSTQKFGSSLVVTLSDAKNYGAYDIHLVTVSPQTNVKILRGENSGKTFSYANAVTQWRSIGIWDGQGTATLKVSDLSPGKQAVLVQLKGHGEIVAASWIH
tara:strand:- start:104 stop:802 length:699 start_codon:yes stop_codon:yes gene_type:complete